MLMSKEEVLKTINAMESYGCGCDVMNGYTCGIHDLARKLRDGLEGPVVNAFTPLTPEDIQILKASQGTMFDKVAPISLTAEQQGRIDIIENQ